MCENSILRGWDTPYKLAFPSPQLPVKITNPCRDIKDDIR